MRRGTAPWLYLLLVGVSSSCGGPGEEGDGGTLGDAGADAAVECRTDVDCDDGLFCDGVETCGASGRCAAGAVTLCDDGVACTTDVCSESLRRCVARVADADGDGAGDASCRDGTGTPLGTDCDDADAARFPGNHEVCDGAAHDEDCDASTHGGVDADGDGVEDARCCNGTDCGPDCDDAHASAHPGATEACNLVDDDCDTHIDEAVAVTGFVDADRDGYGDPSAPLSACGSAAGFSADGTDCDDAVPARNPGQPEFCDAVDNDCDGHVDESASAVSWYVDADGDGFGSAASGTTSSCAPPAGYVLRGSDCDDRAAAISPASPELCNGVDDDCNGVADFAIGPGDLEDDDRDGLADARCGAPRGVDCDDRDRASGPGSIEACDGRDNDCDGRSDEGATEVVFYRDADGDGFGTSANVRPACTAPAGYVPRGGDCDDTTPARAPGALEACDAVDQDCDGAVDEAGASASCSAPHATMACVAGACVAVGCETAYADCSSETAGCESDLRVDPRHCGSCAPCIDPLASCSSARCGPVIGSLAAIDTDPGDVVVERVVAIPASSDYVIVGRFTATLHLGTFTLTSLGDYDGFAARVRLDGAVAWAQRWGGAGFDAMHAVAMLPDGSALVVGGQLCSATLCGGPISGCSGFWQRFASAAAVGCNYADGIGASTASIEALAMERIGSITYVYGAGTYTGTPNHGLGVASSSVDGFVFRARETATQPAYEWTRQFSGLYEEVPLDLALEGPSGIAIVGYTSSSADFGAGPTGHAGYDDAFLVDLDRTNGSVRMAGQFGTSSGYDHAERIVLLANGDVAIAGYYAAGSGFAFPGTPILPGLGPQNGFVLTATAGTFAGHWAVGFDGHADVTGLAVRGTDVLAAGYFDGTVALDRGAMSSVARSAFVAALDQATGATSFARSTRGGPSERSGGAIGLPDGRVVWEIDHSGQVAVGSDSLSTGVDVDAARVVMTP